MAEKKKALLQIDPRVMGHIALQSNFPRYWFQWGDKVVIEPVPDAVYHLLLYIPDWPSSELTNDEDLPDDLPPEFHRCIVDFACYVLSFKLKRWKQAGLYYNTYIKNLRKRKKDYINRKAEAKKARYLPEEVYNNTIRKEVDSRALTKIPDQVVYQGGLAWGH